MGSNCLSALIAAIYAVIISGVFTPGCNNLVFKASCKLSINTFRKSVLSKQTRKSSIAG